MRAHDIERLLANKHADDVFVPQCKDGASYGQGLLILDAWAMKKSWANPCATGYEIKVSRSDFARDEKWRGYLAYCNEFYFVCPAGLLKPEEIPAPAGLMTVSGTGNVLFKKKRAEWREVVIPDSIFRYVLFTRTKVTRENRGNDKRLFWENWLKEKKIDQSFGWSVRGAIRKEIDDRILKVEAESKALAEKHHKYEDIRRMLERLGINESRWLSVFDVESKIKELKRAVPQELEIAVRSLTATLAKFESALKGIESKQMSEAA